IILVGSGVKAFQGVFRYWVTLHHDTSSLPSGLSILEHHEAFLFNGFFFYTFLLFVTNGPRRQKQVAACLLPLVILANAWNARRSATGAPVLALLVLIPVFCIVYRERRTLILRTTAASLFLFSIYAAAFWNSRSVLAQPVHAIRSQITPDERDESSDAYRKVENSNLLYTISQSAILGYGY